MAERKKFKAIGKAFALKGWPWPSPTWWMGDTRVQVPRTSNISEKIEQMKPQLDALMRREFVCFVGIENMMSTHEWMTSDFQSAVTVSHPCGLFKC
jgi:hypothetical protein